MQIATIEVDPKWHQWWVEVREIYDGREEYVDSINYIGGDFENWCSIPYSALKDIISDEDDEYLFVLVYGSDDGVEKEYNLELLGKDDYNHSVYFNIIGERE